MNLAEHVLEALEMVAPGGVVLGEQALDRIAEALQSNAQRVKGFGFFGAQGLGVKLPGAFESFECEAFRGKAADGNEPGPLVQSALQALP